MLRTTQTCVLLSVKSCRRRHGALGYFGGYRGAVGWRNSGSSTWHSSGSSSVRQMETPEYTLVCNLYIRNCNHNLYIVSVLWRSICFICFIYTAIHNRKCMSIHVHSVWMIGCGPINFERRLSARRTLAGYREFQVNTRLFQNRCASMLSVWGMEY